jgi:hypothetical protein
MLLALTIKPPVLTRTAALLRESVTGANGALGATIPMPVSQYGGALKRGKIEA